MTRREKFFATNLTLLVLVSAFIGAEDSAVVASGLMAAGGVSLMYLAFVRRGGIQEGDATAETEEEEDDAILNG
jgi:hypothetical protein